MYALLRTLAASALLVLSKNVRAGEVITLTSGEWLSYISEKSPHYGPVSRIVTEAFALEGVQVKYVFRPWSRAYAEAANGSANGAARRDTDRRRDFLFSDTVFDSQSVLFHLKTFVWDGDSLVGKRVGGTAGYEYSFDKNPQIKIDRAAASDELNFRKLLAGRFDLFPASLLLDKKNPDSGRHLALFNRGLRKLRDSGKYAEYMRPLQ